MQALWVIPTALIVLAIPLMLGMVPPNSLYGFRTPKTLSSPQIWYPANRISGIYFALAGVAIPVLYLTLRSIGWSLEESRVAMLVILLGPVATALGASFAYLRKL